MKNIPLLIATLFGTMVLIGAMVMVFSRQAAPQELDPQLVAGEARLVKGATQSAQVTVVEFSDFQCPACRAIEPLVSQVAATYPDKVRVIYRHYPLVNIHQNALLAAQASEVAAESGKFWEMHDLLFDRQSTWSQLKTEAEAKDQFAAYAEELGIDKATFLEKIDSEAIKQRVATDVATGNQIKIQATPTLFVNGRQLTAPQQLLTTVESFLK